MPSLHFSRWLAAVAVTSVTLSWHGHAQQTPAPARASGTLQTGVTAVLVDVVVRDKRGQPVRDLRPSEFEVFEDGILQPITSVTGIFEGTPTAPLPPDPEPAATPPGRNSGVEGEGGPEASPLGTPVTALVFDRLTPEARRLALRAARSYLADRPEAPHMIGVFGIDLAFTPYAPFTRDTRMLRQAFDTIERRASSGFGVDREQMKLTDAQAKAATSAADAAVAGAGGANPQNMGATADAQLAQMAQRMQNEFEALERNEQGYTFVNSLSAIINTMRSLRGSSSSPKASPFLRRCSLCSSAWSTRRTAPTSASTRWMRQGSAPRASKPKCAIRSTRRVVRDCRGAAWPPARRTPR
jgi:hypothetical protein